MDEYRLRDQWLLECEKQERELAEEERKLQKRQDDLSWEWAHALKNDEGRAILIEEEKHMIESELHSIARKREENAKKYGDRRPQYSVITAVSLCFIASFLYWFPAHLPKAVTVWCIAESALELVGCFLIFVALFVGVDGSLKWVRNSEHHRGWKTTLVTAAWCLGLSLVLAICK